MKVVAGCLLALIAGALLFWSAPALAHAGHHIAPAAATAPGVGTADAAAASPLGPVAEAASAVSRPAQTGDPALAHADRASFVSGPADCPPAQTGHGSAGACCHASACASAAALAPSAAALMSPSSPRSDRPAGHGGLSGLSGLPTLPPPRAAN